MKLSRHAQLAASFVLLAGVISGPNATAEITNCTAITSLPVTIATQGIYCLTAHLSTALTSGNAVTISANNVTLDLNGWKIGGQAAGTGTAAIGIQSSALNVTIRNGIVRGFATGIQLSGDGAVIEDMLVDFSTTNGMSLSGSGTIVRNNKVFNTGGTTLGDVTVYGIFIDSNESRLLNNDVRATIRNAAGATQSAFGVRFVVSAGVAEGNRITNSQDYGLYSSNNSQVFAVGNRIANSPTVGNIGLRMNAGTTGIYRDNLVAGFTTAYSGGTDAGNNQSIP